MLARIPLWPFAILAALVVYGLWQRRARSVSPVTPAIVAAVFLGLSLYSVIASFGAGVAALAAWALGLAASVSVGARAFGPRDLAVAKAGRRVVIPGSWVPLVLMAGIFVARFVVGFVAGAGLAVGRSAGFAPVVSLVLGVLSGGFVARAVTVLRFARAARGMPA